MYGKTSSPCPYPQMSAWFRDLSLVYSGTREQHRVIRMLYGKKHINSQNVCFKKAQKLRKMY